MLRIYHEHPEYGEYTRFDTASGRLTTITEEEFRRYLAPGHPNVPAPPLGGHEGLIRRTDANFATVFTGETPETHTRFPRRVYFQVTRNCNLGCRYCFLKSRPGLMHVPTTAALQAAAFLGRQGLMEVRLTGGEPTTHPGFFAILDAFVAHDVYVSVATNGLISRAVLDGLARRKNLWLICSIDGSRETHNFYRPDTFDKIVENLRELRRRSAEMRLRLTTVLTRRNMHEIRELGLLGASLGAESITIIPLRPQVRDEGVKAEMLTAPEFRGVLEEMVRVMDETGVRMTTTLATDLEPHIWKDPVVLKRSSCAAGREATNLDYDAAAGQFLVYGCSYSPACDLDAPPEVRRPFLAGEFPTDDMQQFLTIWRDDTRWAIYRDPRFKSPECRRCDYFLRHQCVGSCPIQNVDYAAIDVGRDVLRQLEEQIAQTGEWYCYRRILDSGAAAPPGFT